MTATAKIAGVRINQPPPKIDLDAIPTEMREHQRWMLWNFEIRGGRTTKVPRLARRPSAFAKVDDPTTWGSFDDALMNYEDGKADGIGFVLGDGFAGVDLDDCIDVATREIQRPAREIIERLSSYTEISPSGCGIKIFLHGTLPPGGRRKGNIEMYAEGRYFTVTGQHLADTPVTIEERTPELAAFHASVFATANGGNGKHARSPAAPVALDDSTLITRARAARNGAKFSALYLGDTSEYDSASEADLALCNLLAFWADRDAARIDRLFRDSGLFRPKWDERHGASTYGEHTIATAVSGCCETYASDRRAGSEPSAARRKPKRSAGDGKANGDTPGVTLDDFYAVMPQHNYLFVPSREPWPAASVNGRIKPIKVAGQKITASQWLDANRPVEQMAWTPGEPMLVEGRLISDGGWIYRPGFRCLNLYREPQINPGDPTMAGPWLNHLQRVYPTAADHMLCWLAHRVQRPGEKINHALVIGGAQGIGKDTILEPVKHAVGPWNFIEVTPIQVLGRFNGFMKSVILRVSEARDLGDVDRYGLYEHLKIYTAAPPDVLRCDEKNLREHAVLNVCGVIITTNHKTNGIYLPADDRRHFVAWSDLTKEDFTPDYWRKLYTWFASEGNRHVAAYLNAYDLGDFDPKAPPPKTAAFWDVVDASRAPEDAELADALDALRRPGATTLGEIGRHAEFDFAEWLRDRKNSRQIPYRMEAADYVPVRNESTKDGRWKIGGKNQVVYARKELSIADRFAAARRLAEASR